MILLNIVMLLISAAIMYYLFENYDFKVAGFLYLMYSIGNHWINNGFDNFLIYLIIYIIKAVIVTFVYYKIYSISYSFWKFFGLSLIVEALLFGLYMTIGI